MSNNNIIPLNNNLIIKNIEKKISITSKLLKSEFEERKEWFENLPPFWRKFLWDLGKCNANNINTTGLGSPKYYLKDVLNSIFEMRELYISDAFEAESNKYLKIGEILDLSPIYILRNIEKLSFDTIYSIDLKNLSRFRMIRELILWCYNHSNEEYFLKCYDKLEYLQIIAVDNLKNLSNLSSLKELYIEWLNFDYEIDFSSLNNLQNLKSFCFSTQNGGYSRDDTLTQGRKIRFYRLDNPNIEELVIDSYIEKLEDVITGNNLLNLKILGIIDMVVARMDGDISDISILEKYNELEEIWINRQKISDISVLYKLPNLKKVYLSDNPISMDEIENFRKFNPHCEVIF